MAAAPVGNTVKAHANAATKPNATKPDGAKQAAAKPTPSANPARPRATQTHRPIADILPSIAGMPRWLEDVLLAAGLMAAAAYATEPVAVYARRRRQRRNK
jgi:hypothetical protein